MRCQRLTKGKQHLKSPCISNRLTHTGSFLFSDGCFSAGQIATISLLAVIVASHDNHPVLHECCNCRPFVFIVVRCIARQAYRKVKTWKHFGLHNCIKMLSQFRTLYCTNLRQYSKRPKRGGAHDNAQLPNLQFFASSFCAKNLSWPITL